MHAVRNQQAHRDREFFNKIAGSYCKKDLRDSSRPSRQHRLLQTLADFQGEMPRQSILEIGCGGGFSPRYLKGDFGDYLGVDHSAELIEYAQQHFSDAAFRCCDALSLDPERPYDGVFMIGVLHHMESPADQLKAFYTFLTPGGWIAMNEPNSANPLIQWTRFIRKALDPHYSEDQRTYDHRSLERAFTDAGFVDVKTRGQGVFSTPFAEVPLRPDGFWAALSRLAIRLDAILESRAPQLLRHFSWNLIATARKPVHSS